MHAGAKERRCTIFESSVKMCNAIESHKRAVKVEKDSITVLLHPYDNASSVSRFIYQRIPIQSAAEVGLSR